MMANRVMQIGSCAISKSRDNPQRNRVYDTDGLSPTLNTMQGGGHHPCIIDGEDDMNLKSKDKKPKSLIDKTQFEEGKALNMDLFNQTTNENISQCLTAPEHNSQRLFDGLRIRRLTPKECWRLMGFTDEEFEKAQSAGLSNTQLYKQAGNSIVVNVLVEIFRNLYGEDRPKAERQMDIYEFTD